MSSVGETLRRERLRKGLTLEQVSRETKIPSRLLDALEREQFQQLPGGVFAKSFARQYAQFLGLDDEELSAEVGKVVNPVVDLPNFDLPGPDPTSTVSRIMDWPSGAQSNTSTLRSLAMVVAVMLVCSAVYAWWQKSRQPVTTALPAATSEKGQTVPKAAESQANSGGAASSSVTPADGALHVSLRADADAWVQAWADGKSVMTELLQPNMVKTLDATDAVRIRTGNAGGLSLTVNGKSTGPIGPSGQVRTVQISRAGVQILPPPKPAPAPALEPL